MPSQKIIEAFFEQSGIETPIFEHRFHPKRKWRFDVAWPDFKVAIEIEGGVWTKGRHNRPAGFIKDIEKYNEAALRGWILLRVLPNHLLTAKTEHDVLRALLIQKARNEAMNETNSDHPAK